MIYCVLYTHLVTIFTHVYFFFQQSAETRDDLVVHSSSSPTSASVMLIMHRNIANNRVVCVVSCMNSWYQHITGKFFKGVTFNRMTIFSAKSLLKIKLWTLWKSISVWISKFCSDFVVLGRHLGRISKVLSSPWSMHQN